MPEEAEQTTSLGIFSNVDTDLTTSLTIFNNVDMDLTTCHNSNESTELSL